MRNNPRRQINSLHLFPMLTTAQRMGRFRLALVGWIGVIFWFSSQPDLRSGLETWQDVLLRKAAHLAEYFVLSYLYAQSLKPALASTMRRYLAVMLFAVAVASADEWFQTRVRGRLGTPWDVGVDALGAAAWALLQRRLTRARPSG